MSQYDIIRNLISSSRILIGSFSDVLAALENSEHQNKSLHSHLQGKHQGKGPNPYCDICNTSEGQGKKPIEGTQK